MGGRAGHAGAKASRNLGLDAHVTFSGALAWPFIYPWPQRPAGLVETAFDELAKRWKPILDAYDKHGVDVCYEIHPGEDVFDGATFEMFLDAVKGHPRCCINYDPSHFVLQQLDYLAFIDIYHERIKAFHVKDAEFNPIGRQGVYSGFQPWVNRAGRFRSLGDGQVDFGAIFSKLAAYDYDGWAVLEWECCLKDSEQGAAEGAPFIESHIIKVTEKSFDDFAAGAVDKKQVQRMLGISNHPLSLAGRGDLLIEMEARRKDMAIEGAATPSRADASGWAWWAAARAPSSAPCIGSPRAWTITMSSSPARCRRRRSAPRPRARSSASRPTASTPTIARWRRRKRKRQDGIEAVAIVTPNHIHVPGRQGVHRSRHPCDLRQAAGASISRRRSRSQKLLDKKKRRDLRPHPQLLRLSDDPPGPRHGGERANSARSAWCRPNIRRTG